MRPCTFGLILLLLSLAPHSTSVSAGTIAVDMDPDRPLTNDIVRFRIRGMLTDLCWWEHPAYTCQRTTEHNVEVRILAVDSFEEGDTCDGIRVPYNFVCEMDPFPEGNHTIHIVEAHRSIREPDPIEATFTFHVGPMTPVRPTSWGAVRALYRNRE